jgi:hypothetical protein
MRMILRKEKKKLKVNSTCHNLLQSIKTFLLFLSSRITKNGVACQEKEHRLKINTRSEVNQMFRVSREEGKDDFEGLQESEAKPGTIMTHLGSVKPGFDENGLLCWG